MTVPIEILKIKDDLRDGYHILCRTHINKKEFRMLLDTGSSMTIFDKKKSKDISKNQVESNNQSVLSIGNSNIKSEYIVIDEMVLGDIILKDYKTVLIDLDYLNQHFKNNGESQIDGIIGGDILYKYNAIIDYDKKYMILY